jgi:hypothetical protein
MGLNVAKHRVVDPVSTCDLTDHAPGACDVNKEPPSYLVGYVGKVNVVFFESQ